MRLWPYLVVIALAVPVLALADGAPLTAEKVEFAAKEHDLGYQAYAAGDFARASTHLENAFFAAPKADGLRGAILARRRAGHLARAATLSALALARYESDAATSKLAREVMAESAPRVQDVTLRCEETCGVVVDGRVVSIDRGREHRFFLEPGSHEAVVSFSSARARTMVIDARAGGKVSLSLEPPPMPVPSSSSSSAPPIASSSAPVSPSAPPLASKPLGRAPFFIGAGLTALAVGAVIASGLDAQANPGVDAVRRECVGLGERCDAYQRGRDAQMRTNVLIAVAGGFGAVTAVVGLFFTQWSPLPSRASRVWPVIGAQGLGAAGSF